METRGKIFLAGIVTIVITVTGALLSEVFSPMSESLKDLISPVPNASITSATTFSSKYKNVSEEIEPSQNDVSSKAIMFSFEVPRNETVNSANSTFTSLILGYFTWLYSLFSAFNQYEYQYECSFDGNQFEDCISPKPYGNLETEQIHFFKVRTKGLLGNTQNKPTEWNFTVVTSSVLRGTLEEAASKVKGIHAEIENSSVIPVRTDAVGRFSFRNIGQGEHVLLFIKTVNQSNNCPLNQVYDLPVFVPAGQPWKDLGNLLIDDMGRRLDDPCSPTSQYIADPSEFDESAVSPEVQQPKNGTLNENLSLVAKSKKIRETGNAFETQIYINGSAVDLSKIRNVTYYLHPTFDPDTINSTNAGRNFTVSLNNWGVFALNADLNFENDTQVRLTLPANNWTVTE